MGLRDARIAAPSHLPQPIRAEVFGIERLRLHAKSLAAAQPTADPREKGRRLLPRVRENGKVLVAGYRDIVEAVRRSRSRIRTRSVEEYPVSVSTELRFTQVGPCPSPTTVSSTGSRSCSDRSWPN